MMMPVIDPEFSGLVPPLSAEEYIQLERNILDAGKCREALIVWTSPDGQHLLIDGHNRLGICVKHGIRFEAAKMAFAGREEAALWIINNQLARRNLSDAARIELAMKKADMLRARARENLTHGGRPSKEEKCCDLGTEKGLTLSSNHKLPAVNVRETLASEAGLSEGKLSQYQQILRQGSPELIAAVKSGKIKIGTAFRLIPNEIAKELTKAEGSYEGIKDSDTAAPMLAHLAALLDALTTKKGACHA
ncbi:MAG: hypothetical protein FWD90_08590 [Defluviitaleaceae bacterium]|nr:hypothetical protein [Defluviitaleaceae bacterium]